MAFTNINNLYPRPSVTGANTSVSGRSLTVGASATAFTASAFASTTNLVLIDVQDATVTVTFDGTAPVAGTRGHELLAGTNYTWSLGTAQAAKFIRTGGTDGFLFLSEFQI